MNQEVPTNRVDNLETVAAAVDTDKAAVSDNDSCFSDMEEGFYSGDEIRERSESFQNKSNVKLRTMQ